MPAQRNQNNKEDEVMQKKSKTRAVVAMTAKDLEQAKTKSEPIAAAVRNDIQVAENGLIHALRAGLGLLRIRSFYEHGEWALAQAALFPDKSGETLRRYMKIAENFCEKRQIAPLEAWNGMQTIRTDRLLAAPKENLAKTNPENKLQQAVIGFANEFDTQGKAAKGEADAQRGKDGRPLTKAERMEAARAIWNKITSMAQDELNHGSAMLLNNEDLDGLAAVLRTVSDSLRKQLAARNQKI